MIKKEKTLATSLVAIPQYKLLISVVKYSKQ